MRRGSGKPLDNVGVTVDVRKTGRWWRPRRATVEKLNRSAEPLWMCPRPAPKGDYVVRATAKDADGKPFGVPGEEPLAWAGGAVPRGAGRRPEAE